MPKCIVRSDDNKWFEMNEHLSDTYTISYKCHLDFTLVHTLDLFVA